MRFACDTGGTFTDLLVEAGDDLRMYKAHTVPGDPAKGVLDALNLAAVDRGVALAELLGKGEVFVHGTTHAINAIITGRTAKTGFLTTSGHPDTLVLREGGRTGPFDHTVPYPEPYIPRALTFEIGERVDHAGRVKTALDEASVLSAIAALKAAEVEAVAVCLLWSIVNPSHELRVGELLAQHLPGVAVTLSHQLNPTLREYRRASATAIDASLKPMMGRYLGGIEARMTEAGFTGRFLVLTSQGGTMDAAELAKYPIHAINSGPSMAPIAGKYFAALDGSRDGQGKDIVVADTGGTTYDVSLVRAGQIPFSRETWIGTPYRGHMTGFPSVDVKSVGAGGGSIAWVDAGGVLHVGPQSAGSTPGPVCYSKGGTEPTTTDACVALGYLDPDYFLGGAVKLDAAAARAAIETRVAGTLGLSVEEAAASIIDLVTENMVQAIADITVNQGIDASESILIGGGGAAGLNSVKIGRRLGCQEVIFPEVGAALSAGGALLSDLTAEFRAAFVATSDRFDFAGAGTQLASMRKQAEAFTSDSGKGALASEITFAVEARYPSQVWDLEVAVPNGALANDADLAVLIQGFHDEHRRVFAIDDPESGIEITGIIVRVRCKLRDTGLPRLSFTPDPSRVQASRKAYFAGHGWADTAVLRMDDLAADVVREGPAIVETPFTTIVIDPKAKFWATAGGAVVVQP